MVVVCTACALLGCSTTAVITPRDASAKVKVGDDVEIVTRDGKTHDFEVVAISADAIRGPTQTIAMKDVKSLTVSEFSGTKTAGLVAGIAAAVGIIWIIAVHAFGNAFDDKAKECPSLSC